MFRTSRSRSRGSRRGEKEKEKKIETETEIVDRETEGGETEGEDTEGEYIEEELNNLQLGAEQVVEGGASAAGHGLDAKNVFRGDLSLVVSPPNLIENDVLGQKSLKKLRDMKSLYSSLSPQNQSMTDFLKGIVCICNDIQPKLTTGEYKQLLLSLAGEKYEMQIRKTLNYRGLKDITTNELHSLLIILSGESQSLSYRKTRFFTYKPTHKIGLSDLVTQVYALGGNAELSEGDIFEKLLNLLPNEASGELRNRALMSRMLGNTQSPSAIEILDILSSNKYRIDSALAKMYGNDRTDVKINKVSVETKRPPTQVKAILGNPNRKNDYCLICLGGNHSTDRCFYKNTASCLLCGGAHVSPHCQVYCNINPVLVSCSICERVQGVKLYHPEKDCHLKKEKTKN